MTEQVDCVVIGAGVVGLAIARALAMAGRDVLILEAADAIGTGISSRNSEVIHAGLYYPEGSLKARLCVEGNQMLRDFAGIRGVDFRMTGKLVAATCPEEEAKLAKLFALGRANGTNGLEMISGAQARSMEPELVCTAALWSPDTGIVDTHALMLALLADAEAHGAQLVTHAQINGGARDGTGMILQVGGTEPMDLSATSVVVAAGLGAPDLGRALGLRNSPTGYLCRGNYFSLTGPMPFSRLIYPIPAQAGLGVHYTLDLQGRGRFGPDVEWVEAEDYQINPERAQHFYPAIARYWPGIAGRELVPAYAGIRPKIVGPGGEAADFAIHGPETHGVSGVVALYGIESPGLTSSLALGRMVSEMLT